MENKILEELIVYTPSENYKRIRVGKGSDGGYVLLDININKIEAFYSYGVNDDYSFDDEFSKISCSVGRLFDPTVSYPNNITENLSFKKIGLATGEGTITQHVQGYGDFGKKMILKIDVEGAEWDWLETTNQEELRMFDQILIEYHGMDKTNQYEKYTKCLNRINEHFYLYHVHGNNHRPLVPVEKSFIPDVIECSYIRKELVPCEENRDVNFPIEGLDRSNHHWLPDIPLGYWPYILDKNESSKIGLQNADDYNKQFRVYQIMYNEILRQDSAIEELRQEIEIFKKKNRSLISGKIKMMIQKILKID